MSKLFAYGLCGALSLYIAISSSRTAFADNSVAPVRLDRDRIAGLGLTAIPPDAYKDILVRQSNLNMRVATLFEGKQLRAEVFESTPAKTNHRNRPTDGDEFVYVLSGKLILTETNGTVQEFRPGDSLVLPRLHRHLGHAGQLPRTGGRDAKGSLAT